MTPGQIKKAVEDYRNLLIRQERLQKRIINLSGRDPEQEFMTLQQLESIERMVEMIHHAIDDLYFLTFREATVLDYRTQGLTYEQIGKIFSLNRETIRVILKSAYKKMARAAKEQNIA